MSTFISVTICSGCKLSRGCVRGWPGNDADGDNGKCRNGSGGNDDDNGISSYGVMMRMT